MVKSFLKILTAGIAIFAVLPSFAQDTLTYENCVALRAVISTDGMTADWFDFPHNFLQDVSNKIINNVKESKQS